MKKTKRWVAFFSVLLLACMLCGSALAAPSLNNILGALRNTQGSCNTGGQAASGSCSKSNSNALLQQLLQRLYGQNAASAKSTGNTCTGSACTGNTCAGNTCTGSSCTGNSCTGNSCTGNTRSGSSCPGSSGTNNVQQFMQQIQRYR